MKHAADEFLEIVSGRKRGLRAGVRRAVLRAGSCGYGLGVWARNRLYDRQWLRSTRVAAPVISVGNLTVGGTGKTPCVEYVARYLSDKGRRVAILSRGYASMGGASDEAMLLKENLPDVPHLVGADRMVLAQVAVDELERDALVLDDGFQHRRLNRTFDLVLIDATEPWGFGSLLPRGLLRESPRELKRAHAVMLTRCDLASAENLAAVRERIGRLSPGIPVFESEHQPRCWINSDGRELAVDELNGVAAAAFCGIGNPQGFFGTLNRLGMNVVEQRRYPDHHRYSRGDVEELEQWAIRQPAEAVMLTTQKDLVKLRISSSGGRPLWALKIGLSVRKGEEQLKQMLEHASS